MLAQLRGAVRSKAALVLIGLLVLSFAVWGLSDVFAGRTGIGLAGAGDRRVLKADVERALDSYLQSEREQGRPSNREDAARAGVLTAIIQGQAGRAAELRYADEAGIRASAEAAARILADAPRFKDALTGDFDSEAYRAYLAQIGESPASFEKSLRDDLTSDYIRDAVGAGVDTPTALARLWVLNQTETRSIAYVLVPPGTAAEVVEPTDEELSSFYEARQSLFTQPERRRVSIMSVSPADFIDQVEVPDEDVQTAYEIRLRELSGPETRVLAQLSGADRSAVQEAADQIVAGATPEDAANTVDGVDLTVLRVQESELADDAFASAAFRAPEGDVLIPTPSGSGWATALIREVIPGEAPAFEDVEELLRQDLAQRDAERIFETNLESLYDFVGGGFEISEIATEMGVPLLRFAPIDVRATTQSGAFVGGVARFPDAMQTAFDALEGELSDIIEDDNDGVYVLSLDEVVPQNAPPLETIREDVLATYKTIRRAEALEEIASGIATAATSLETLQSNAAAAGLETIVLDAPVERRAPPPNVDNQILAQAFALAEQSAGVTPTADGGSAVVWVDAIMRDDASDAPALLDVGKRILADSIRSDLEIAFRQAAVEVSDLQINSGEIETYVQSMAGEE